MGKTGLMLAIALAAIVGLGISSSPRTPNTASNMRPGTETRYEHHVTFRTRAANHYRYFRFGHLRRTGKPLG